MDEIDVQLNETIPNENQTSGSIGRLILEELRFFRREMTDEVRKLNWNLQNFMLSKTDMVNCLLENSLLFNDLNTETEKSNLNNNFQRNKDSEDDVSDNCESLQQECEDGPGLTDTSSQHALSTQNLYNSEHPSTDVAGEDGTFDETISHKPNNNKISFDNARPVEIQIYQHNKGTTNRKVTVPARFAATLKHSNTEFCGLKKPTVDSHFKSRVEVTKQSNPICHTTLKKSYLHRSSGTILNHAKLSKVEGHVKPFGNSSFLDVKFFSRMRNKCKFCDKTFLSSNDLKRHIRIHTGDRPYQCRICTKAYTRNDHLKRHIRQKHLITDTDQPSF